VYYASFPYFHNEDDWNFSSGFGKTFSGKSKGLFDGGFNEDDYYSLYREFKIVVKGQGRKMSQEEILKNQEARRADAVIALAAVDDNFYGKQGFELEKPLKLEIAALGEARKGEESEFDYGWIVNVDTREKVWKFWYRDSEHAGGARKIAARARRFPFPLENTPPFSSPMIRIRHINGIRRHPMILGMGHVHTCRGI
jgi:hypothetical protein